MSARCCARRRKQFRQTEKSRRFWLNRGVVKTKTQDKAKKK